MHKLLNTLLLLCIFSCTYLFSSFEYQVNQTKIRLLKQNIFTVKSDALVNAANEECLSGGGIDGQFVKLGGKSLAQARLNIPEVETGIRCPLSQARITRAGDIKAKFVIHAVGPRCSGLSMTKKEKELLANTYLNTIKRAQAFNSNPKDKNHAEFSKIDISDLGSAYKISSITFPTISTGIFGATTAESAEDIINIIIKYFKENINTDIKEINFVFYEPSNPTKADQDFDNYVKVFKKLV